MNIKAFKLSYKFNLSEKEMKTLIRKCSFCKKLICRERLITHFLCIITSKRDRLTKIAGQQEASVLKYLIKIPSLDLISFEKNPLSINRNVVTN